MDRRRFLAAAAIGAAALPACASAQRAPNPERGPALLTVTGAVGRGNRGPLDPALDQMMVKQGVAFDRAHVFDFDALTALPAESINPTLEYDSRPHRLSGPLISDVLQAAEADTTGTSRLVLRAVDGYAVTIPLQEAVDYGFIVATHLDGRPMPLGGLGPLWAVYDADRFPEMAARPVGERFIRCPWGLYHMDVQPA